MSPRARAEISYADPGDPVAFEDETAYLIAFNFGRGRQNETDRPGTGSGGLDLRNVGGRFAPANTAGPHYPNVRPMRRAKISLESDAAAEAFTMRRSTLRGGAVLRGGTLTFGLVYGFTEAWPQTWDPSNADSRSRVRLADGFAVFNLAKFVWGQRYNAISGEFFYGYPSGEDVVPATGPPFIPDDLAGARIGRVLDAIGWPDEPGDRELDEGTVEILGSDQAFGGATNIKLDVNALSHMIDVAMTEGGIVFVTATGAIRYIDAASIAAADVDEIFGGDVAAGETPYRDIATSDDIARLWNRVTVATVGGVVGTFQEEDATSIARYFPRERSVTLLAAVGAVSGTTIAGDRALELLARYKEPKTRIERLVFRCRTEAEWRKVLRHEIGDVVRVVKRPGGGADDLVQDCRIEGISVDMPNLAELNLSWALSEV